MSFMLAHWALQDMSSSYFTDLLSCYNPTLLSLSTTHASLSILGLRSMFLLLSPTLGLPFRNIYFWITTWIHFFLLSKLLLNAYLLSEIPLLPLVFNSSACSSRVTPGLILFPHNLLHISSMHYHFQNNVWYIHCSFLLLPGRKADSQFTNELSCILWTTVPIYYWCDQPPWHSVWSLDKQELVCFVFLIQISHLFLYNFILVKFLQSFKSV